MAIKINGHTVAIVGANGKSAYQIAVENGFEGTEADFASSMTGGMSSFNGRKGDVMPQDGDYTAEQVGAVPKVRTVNGKSLSTNINLTASDVGAAASEHTHSGYAAASHTHTPAQIGAAPANHSHSGYLPIAGGTVTGNLTLKGSGNFGTQLNFGDGDYVHISEPTDDCLEIKAKKINFKVSDTTDERFTLNGEKIGGGGGSSGVTTFNGRSGAVSPAAGDYTAAMVGAAVTNHSHTPSEIGASPATHTHTSAPKLTTARNIDGMSFDGSASIDHYGTCSTAASTVEKVVSQTGFNLTTGARIAVKFSYKNTAANPTLNVNSTGAKPIVAYGTTKAASGEWDAGELVEFVYNGTNFAIVNGSARRKAMSGGSSGSKTEKIVVPTISNGGTATVTVESGAGEVYLVCVQFYGTAILDTSNTSSQILLYTTQGNVGFEMVSNTSIKFKNNGAAGSNPIFITMYKLG